MQQPSAPHMVDTEERAEMETMVAALARTPRLASLLRYLGEKYFDRRSDEINEYNIATEVFGRSKTSFDASRDSIARVEAYRLRKKLKEYYETEGKEHEISISLPTGSYVPLFSRRLPEAWPPPAREPLANPEASRNIDQVDGPSAAPEPQVEIAQAPPESSVAAPVRPAAGHSAQPALWYWVAAIAALVLVVFGAIRFFPRMKSAHGAITSPEHASNANQVTPPNAVEVPFRMLAGYEGAPRIDSSGAYWEADKFFKGGAAYKRSDAFVSRTSDPMLFDYWRTGNFEYNIPLAPGTYELHLFFVASQPEDISQNYFYVIANWQALLPPFNISSDALGINTADERVFRDVSPNRWGYLQLGFNPERGTASLNAIELLPGTPHKLLPIRLVMQKTAVTDRDGNVWHADNYFQNGQLSDLPQHVAGAPDPSIYTQERFGHFTYSIPVDTRDRYTLVLHFAEMYWGPQASGQGGIGSRLFRVICNGSTLLDNFDIFKEAGSLHPLTKSFYHLRPSPEGKLNLTFEPIVNNATVSAIEVIDESE